MEKVKAAPKEGADADANADADKEESAEAEEEDLGEEDEEDDSDEEIEELEEEEGEEDGPGLSAIYGELGDEEDDGDFEGEIESGEEGEDDIDEEEEGKKGIIMKSIESNVMLLLDCDEPAVKKQKVDGGGDKTDKAADADASA